MIVKILILLIVLLMSIADGLLTWILVSGYNQLAYNYGMVHLNEVVVGIIVALFTGVILGYIAWKGLF